ncbi:MAG: hypothetical protein IJR12_08215 [Bacteroidales bacterium]|nr:hypothetical protein [Bacteroidales bacterium]
MIGKIYMVSVVRDYGMYSRCVLDNPFCRSLSIVTLDNREENLGIPFRYNRFLDSVEEDGWIVFCHEDWMLECDISSVLDGLDKNCLYGPVGVFVEEGGRRDFIFMHGEVRHCSKEGESPRTVYGIETSARVDCFDCQCLIVHSSLVKRYGLRFDQNLLFDMYVEDFCVNAFEKYGVVSRTIKIECTHFSRGSINARFHSSLDYVREKYKGGKKRYATIVGRHNTFGRNIDKPVSKYRDNLLGKVWYRLNK